MFNKEFINFKEKRYLRNLIVGVGLSVIEDTLLALCLL